MRYDFIAIPDADIPHAVEPVFQHVVTTYVSESNKTAGVWRAVPDDLLDFKPHEKVNTIRTILVHQLLSERRFFAQFVGTEEPSVEELLPPGDKLRRHFGGGRPEPTVLAEEAVVPVIGHLDPAPPFGFEPGLRLGELLAREAVQQLGVFEVALLAEEVRPDDPARSRVGFEPDEACALVVRPDRRFGESHLDVTGVPLLPAPERAPQWQARRRGVLAGCSYTSIQSCGRCQEWLGALAPTQGL